jgi:hypothetical protein
MKNKSFSSEFEELKPKEPIHLDTERKLLPRLKFMGYVSYICCGAALVLAILDPKGEIATELDYPEQNAFIAAGLNLEKDEDSMDYNAFDVLNFYVVSSIFAVVATACFVIAWKKKKALFQENQI